MSKSKGKRFVLPKPSNDEDLNTDFSSRLEYYDDEKKGILNIVKIKPRPIRKSVPKSTPKSTPKSAPKSTPKSASKSAPKSASKSAPKSAPKSASKSNRVMSRT
jgi:bifunctional DNA-binding transcriptional regulator/antitoxin component of YhaV-PrlF toxin-antitoxin module